MAPFVIVRSAQEVRGKGAFLKVSARGALFVASKSNKSTVTLSLLYDKKYWFIEIKPQLKHHVILVDTDRYDTDKT